MRKGNRARAECEWVAGLARPGGYTGAVTGLELSPSDASKCSDLVCNACLAGKAHRAPFAGPVSRSDVRLGRVFSNLLTLSLLSLSGCRYAIVFVDDHTRMLWTKPLGAKSDALQATQEWIASVEKSSGCKVDCLHTDNGGEYTSRAFSDYLTLRGIAHTTTTPHSPQQNGVAERVNRTLVKAVLSMLADSGLPAGLWAKAMRTFTHVKDLAPHRALRGRTPHQLWHNTPAPVLHLRAFGCRAWAARLAEAAPHRRKLEPKGDPLIFVGYELGRRAYRLYSPSTHKVTISHDVVFVESEFPALSTVKGPLPTLPAPAVELSIVAPAQEALRPAAAAPPPRQHAARHRSLSPDAPSPGPLATPTPLPREWPAHNEPALPSPAPAPSPESPDFIDMLSSGLEDPFAAGVAAISAAVEAMLP